MIEAKIAIQGPERWNPLYNAFRWFPPSSTSAQKEATAFDRLRATPIYRHYYQYPASGVGYAYIAAVLVLAVKVFSAPKHMRADYGVDHLDIPRIFGFEEKAWRKSNTPQLSLELGTSKRRMRSG